MVKLMQRHRQLPSLFSRDVGLPLDDSFWNRFWNDYWTATESPLQALTEWTADWMPEIDVSETDKEITVKANIAGYEPKDIDVEIENGVLTIQGDMEKEEEKKGKKFYRKERRTGSFHRQIALPPVFEDKAKCKAKNGTITITIPKKQIEQAESKGYKIPVEA